MIKRRVIILLRLIICIFVLLSVMILLRVNLLHKTKILQFENKSVVSNSPFQDWSTDIKFSDQKGNVFETKRQTLFQLKIMKNIPISTKAQCVFPCDEGVGFIENDKLTYWNEGRIMVIAESVSIACWDSHGFVWLNQEKNEVMSYDEGGEKVLFKVYPGQLGVPLILVANKRWVVIASAISENGFYNDTVIFDRQNKSLSSFYLHLDGRDAAFLCENKLIKVGGSQSTFCVLDLISFKLIEMKNDLIADQGNVTASAAYDETEKVFYVSAVSKPELPDFYDVNAATYSIDFGSMTSEKLNKEYYYNLIFCSSNRMLYGSKDILGFGLIRRLD